MKFRDLSLSPGMQTRSKRSSLGALLLVAVAAVSLVGAKLPRAEAQLLAAKKPRPPSGGGAYQSWTQISEFNVTYHSSFSRSFSIPWEWHGSVHDYVMEMHAEASGKIKLLGNNGRYWRYEGELPASGTYSMKEHWYTPTDTLGNVEETGSGPESLQGTMYFSLVIDTETGTYEVVTTDVGVKGTATFSTKDGSFSRDAICQIPCPPHTDNLPGPKPPLVFHKGLTQQAPPLWMLADPYEISMQVDYTVAPQGPKPEFLLKQISPTWIPTAGSTLPVTVVPKNPNQAPAPVRFILEEITQEPGKCLNSRETDTTPDMDFNALANAGKFAKPETVGANSIRMQTEEPVNTAVTATVNVKDYGAWAKLRAEAQIDGSWQPIPVEGSNLGYLTLPVDLDGNKIADAWEKKFKGHPSNWDAEATPKLNGTIGDGLSLYEEYRGLLVNGQHQRLSPLVKKLIVENRAGNAVKPGIALLAKASGLNVITVAEGELPESRQVNANSTLARTRNQYGLRLTTASLEAGTVGVALPVDKPNKRPGTCTEVQVDLGQLQSSPAPFNVQAELDNTVAHELAHGIGASHHGEAGAPLINRFLGTNDVAPNHIVYGSDGKEITDRPFQIKGSIGGPGNMASGDTGCIMCYNSAYQWSVQRTAQGQYRYYAQQYRLPGTKFCTSATGSGVNAAKNKPISAFGNAERGNCLAQLCPKDQ